MTIQEIRDLIAKKIAGQGTQVDVGGGLATILNAICDALATIPSPYTLPAATTEALGGVKIGNGLQVAADGTASLKVPVITEDFSSGPVEITQARYNEILDCGICVAGEKIYTRINIGAGNFAALDDFVSGAIYLAFYEMDDTATPSLYKGFACYQDGDNKCYITSLEI